GRRAPQRRLRQELGVDLIHPRVELVQQGQRAPPALFASRLGVETALLARGLYVVELLEELERDRRPLVLGQQGRMELAADVHAATQAALIGDDDDGLFAVVVLELDFTGVPGVPIALDETRDRSEPVGDVGGLPARGVAVGDHLGAAHDAIGPDEAPEVAAEDLALAGVGECFQVRVVGADNRRGEDARERRQRHGLEQVERIRPVRLQRLVRRVQPHARELPALPVERQAERALVAHELTEQRGVHLTGHAWHFAPGSDGDILAAELAATLLPKLDIDHDLGRHEPKHLVLDRAERLLLATAERAAALFLRYLHLTNVALDARGDLHRAHAATPFLLGLLRLLRLALPLRRISSLGLLGLLRRRDVGIRVVASLCFFASESEQELAQLLVAQPFAARPETIARRPQNAPRQPIVLALHVDQKPHDLIDRLLPFAAREHAQQLRLERLHSTLALELEFRIELHAQAQQLARNRQRTGHIRLRRRALRLSFLRGLGVQHGSRTPYDQSRSIPQQKSSPNHHAARCS